MKMMNLSFRLEAPADYHAVEELTREAFWKTNMSVCDEHLLVRRLRECPSFVPELDYVALLDGKLVAHIIYTKSKIVDDNGKVYETLTFGPLSVLPEYQNKGIGKALMHHTFAQAKKLRYHAVIIFGYPDYYPRVGFRRAAEFGITTADGKTFDPFMVYPLYDGALDGISGRYYLDPVYETLTQEDALEFDKQFPPKEKHIPVPINALLDCLEPEARKAIQKLNLPSLLAITRKSEREISALEGIDEAALAVIRTITRENGLRWGAAPPKNL